MNFMIEGITVETAISLTEENGFINPLIHYIKVKLGKSKLTVGDAFYDWILNQIINIYKVLI